MSAWPRLTESNAPLATPSFYDPQDASPCIWVYFPGRGERPLIQAAGGHRRHLRSQAEMSFPLDEISHLPDDVRVAVESNLARSPEELKGFWGSHGSALSKEEEKCMRGARYRRNSLSGDQKKVRGRANLPLSARVLERLDMGGRLRVRQFTYVFPIIGNVGEPGAYPVDKSRKRPEPKPDLLF